MIKLGEICRGKDIVINQVVSSVIHLDNYISYRHIDVWDYMYSMWFNVVTKHGIITFPWKGVLYLILSTLKVLNLKIYILIHLRLCLATAIHNLKWVKLLKYK